MTTFYPEVSGYPAGISLAGAGAVGAKATEGVTYANPSFEGFRSQAASHKSLFFAYHFLHAGAATAQAELAHRVAGAAPLMIDCEPTMSAADMLKATGSMRSSPRFEVRPSGDPLTAGSRPTIGDVAAFCDAYRRAGGTVHLVYLPRWYWQSLGSPSLAPLKKRGLRLVSSQYTAYSDSGPGWSPYGGMRPVIWQFSGGSLFNGFEVDVNACKGSLAQLRSLVHSGTTKPEPAGKPHQEGPMQLPPGVAPHPLSLSNGTKSVRFFTNASAAKPVKIRVDLRGGGKTLSKSLDYDAAWSVKIPKGIHGIVVHRDDSGANVLSVTENH